MVRKRKKHSIHTCESRCIFIKCLLLAMTLPSQVAKKASALTRSSPASLMSRLNPLDVAHGRTTACHTNCCPSIGQRYAGLTRASEHGRGHSRPSAPRTPTLIWTDRWRCEISCVKRLCKVVFWKNFTQQESTGPIHRFEYSRLSQQAFGQYQPWVQSNTRAPVRATQQTPSVRSLWRVLSWVPSMSIHPEMKLSSVCFD